ncbi:hypothetical protein, partial [Paraglaciecola sp.]
MSNPQAPSSEALDGLGKAIGSLTALVVTLPANELLYPLFEHYALSHMNYRQMEYIWFWKCVFIACLFIAIVTIVWFTLVMTIKLVKGLVLGL